LKLLEQHGADLTATNNQGDSLMHMSARENRIDIAGWLIDKGMNPFIKNKLG